MKARHAPRVISLSPLIAFVLVVAACLVPTGAQAAPPAKVAGAGSELSFPLFLNPGLGAGKPFACPAMRAANATVTVTNRFTLDEPNDTMTIKAFNLPPNTPFSLFIVQHSPVDSGTFNGFGFGWYQSDVQSDATGHVNVVVKGIFDEETVVEEPSAPESAVHTFNVGFWFDSPQVEKSVCGNASAPAATPFNGTQDAGLLAMISMNEPLHLVSSAPPGVGVNAPSSGASRVGRSQQFVTICSDSNGWRNISTIDLRFIKGYQTILLAQYDQNAGVMRLYNPVNHKWTEGKPGSRKTLTTKYAAIALQFSRVASAGPKSPSVRVTWRITFQSPARGTGYQQMLRITDDFGKTKGWHTIGRWNVLGAYAVAALPATNMRAASDRTSSTASRIQAHSTASAPCTSGTCTFALKVNPGLLAGKPFACPAIQNATATITITNRFVTGAQNDTMTLTASGLPGYTEYDVFLVQGSPLDGAAFKGFGTGWYQSDMQSDAFGRASVTMQGIFDKEVFVLNPATSAPVHTFNVGFWFGSPEREAQKCGNAQSPAPTPFNGSQNAGLLAMITTGEPLGSITK